MTARRIRERLRRLMFAGLMSMAAIAAAQDTRSPSAPGADLVDLSLEELMEIRIDTVYSASRYEQKVTEAPSSITIITADEIKKFGYRTLADVLRGVPGLYVSDDRNYSYLGVRGFLRPGDYNTRVLMLIDGHRMNDNIYDGSYFSREAMIDVDLIDRVEIIRGPGSSIYGSSAFFGVINVITVRGRQIDGVEASGEAGSAGTYKERFTIGKTFKNGIEWLVSGSYYTSDGQSRLYYPEFDQRISSNLRAANNGVVENRDGEDAFNLFTSLREQDFTLSGFFTSRTKDIPTASFDTVFNDGREKTTDYRGYVDLKYDHSFSDNLRLLGRIFYDNYTYNGVYPSNYAVPGDPPDIVLNKDGLVGEWVGTEWQLTTKVFDRHTLMLGAEYRENIRQYQYIYDDVQPRFYYLKDDRSSRTLGLFAQDDVTILTNLSLIVGLRYDYYFGSFGDTVNPRTGLIYNPWETTTFKALYGRAFRAPNPYERYYYSEQVLRPELSPETIYTYELVCEQYLGRHYRMSVSGYRYEVENLINQTATPTGDLYFDNLNNAHAQGVEFEAEGKFDSGLLARASYALQRTEDAVTGEELSSSPRHLAKFNLSLPAYKDKLFISPELQYQSATLAVTRQRVDEFLVANLTLLSRRVVKDLEVSVGVYNLFDTSYGYPGAEDHLQEVIEQDGRNFRIKVTYRF